MRKVSLLLALAVAGLSGFAQYNSIKIDQSKEKCAIKENKMTSPKTYSTSSVTRDAGEDFWVEDFTNVANGGDADAGWVYEGVGENPGTFMYIDADTIPSNPNLLGGEANPGSNMIANTTPNGYLHLPISAHNCVPGSWPRVYASEVKDLDASATSPWISLADAPDNLLLSYKTLFILCCNPNTLLLDVNVGIDNNGNGEVDTWTTFEGRVMGGELIGLNEWGHGEKIVNISNLIAGASQMKIMFRMHGGTSYIWSLDDIKLVEPHTNELSLLDVYAVHHNLYTPMTTSQFGYWNYNYSEIPSNLKGYMQYGVLAHQAGLNAENAKLNFQIDSATVTGWENIFSTSSVGIIENYGSDVKIDTVLYTDTTGFAFGDYSATKYFYNPELNWSDFSTSELQDNGFSYLFNYEITSDDLGPTSVDAIPENNFDTLPFAQTWGRYSYHWQPNQDFDHPRGNVSPFNLADPTGVTNDMYANIFTMEVEEGDEFKIYGVRFYLAQPSKSATSFSDAGNGCTVSPVLYAYDGSANGGNGDYVNTGISGDPRPLHFADSANYVYLPFFLDEVNAHEFTQGEYLVGFKVDNYNGEEFAIGVDESFPQGSFHSRMKIDPWADEWKVTWTSGATMIDAYTKQEQMQADMVGVETVTKSNLDNVMVYPNPTTGIVNIKNVENSTISVYTITGNLVQTIENNDVNTSINLAGLAKGYYLVKIVTENEVITKKVNLK